LISPLRRSAALVLSGVRPRARGRRRIEERPMTKTIVEPHRPQVGHCDLDGEDEGAPRGADGAPCREKIVGGEDPEFRFPERASRHATAATCYAPGRSPLRSAIVWASGNKWAAGAAAFLLCMYGMALFAGFFAPYGMNQTHYKAPADYRYHHPMRPRVLDQEGGLHWPPFVYGTKPLGSPDRGYAEDRTVRHKLKLFARGEPYSLFFGLLEWDRHLIGVEEPGKVFLLGTDKLGRDLLSRIIYGSRISLSVGLLGIAITFCLGLAIGATSGLLGGYPDSILMRLSEVVMSLPGLYLVVALAGVLPPELSSDTRYLLIVVILSLVGWAGPARVIRGMVLSIRENDYVLAAKAVGAGTPRIVLHHVIPNTMSYIIVAATISVPYYILGEVSLSFLGVGVMEPQASWGLMLSDAQSVTALREFTWLLLPGAFLFLVVMSFNILGDGLRDALDPRARGTRAL